MYLIINKTKTIIGKYTISKYVNKDSYTGKPANITKKGTNI